MPLFTLNFEEDDPLFSMAFHPSKPEFVLGFATGRVICYAYSAESEASDSDEEGKAGPVELWSTKRHKGSCRALSYDQSGTFIVSCGSDGVVKKCDSRSGKVSKKTQIAAGASSLCINEEYVAIGDEEGTLHILTHDLKAHRAYDLEDVDSVTCVRALDMVNKHNFAVSGAMHVFRVDARKDEVVSKSEDQEDEILCGCIASDARSAWGMAEGVLTVWNNRGLGDQQQRVRLTKDGSVDVLLAGEQDNHVIAGTSDGWVAEVDVLSGKVLHRAHHNPDSLEDDIGYLDYDFEYRLVSASMGLLRVWPKGGLAAAEAKEEEAAQAAAAAVAEAKASNSKRGRTDDSVKKKKNKKSKKGTSGPEAPKAFADLLS